jgi:hypothetical protein
MPDEHRLWRVCVIDSRVSRWMRLRYALGQSKNPWIRRSEHALTVR